MKRFLVILPFVFIFSGCAKVAHLPQLLTLKGYSDNKSEQRASVAGHDQKFEALIKAVEDGSIKQYANKKKVAQAFGDPVVVRAMSLKNKLMTEWMYRYNVQFLNSRKVYLFFDEAGLLQQWEVVASGGLSQIDHPASIQQETKVGGTP